jgi:hypothetical protein
MMVELWVGVTPSGWSPVIWILMKWDPEGRKPREEGLSKNIKPNEARTPCSSLTTLEPAPATLFSAQTSTSVSEPLLAGLLALGKV